jgi:proteasome lid subunit RPN8/RPN11
MQPSVQKAELAEMPAEHSPRNDVARVLKFSRAVYEAIRETVGSRAAETGGVFGLGEGDDAICHFAFDSTGSTSAATYTPDIARVNDLFRDRWNPRGIRFVGFVHSHPPGCRQPSEGDRIYAERILRALPHLEALSLPIVMSGHGGHHFELLGYVAERDHHGRAVIHSCSVQVEDQPTSSVLKAEQTKPRQSQRRKRTFRKDPAFARVVEAYDLDRLASSRVVCIGCGGAAGFIEDLARAGVGDFVLVDPDRISIENIATQSVRRSDIGRSKATVLAECIADINPRARIKTKQTRAEMIDLDVWRKLAIGASWRAPAPQQTLLLGMTDNFHAQAFVNRLGLFLNLPSLCAQIYAEGRAAEITWSWPGLTPACHRCMLAPRYDAYENGFKNGVGTAGAPVFSTTRLNALKGFLVMALLHRGSAHKRWGGLLEKIGDRTLVQIRMDPDVALTLGLKSFDRAFGQDSNDRLLFDEAIWMSQAPEPFCPDCGGGC